MPELIYKKAFVMNDGLPPHLTLDKSYEIICAFDSEEGDDVTLEIVNDEGIVHYFDLNSTEFVLTDHFDMLGDYTDAWEEAP